MDEIKFSGRDYEKIEQATLLYILLKKIVITNEELDGNNKTNLQILQEYRNALDHLMRVLQSKFRITNHDEEYIYANLDKFYGHLYRAGYDALDWMSIVTREKITDSVKNFSNDALKEVFPKYYSEIRPKILKLSREIGIRRINKDVDDYTHQDPKAFENFKNYSDVLMEIEDIFENIYFTKVPILIEYEKKQKKQKRKEWIIRLLIAIISAISGVLLKFLLTKG